MAVGLTASGTIVAWLEGTDVKARVFDPDLRGGDIVTLGETGGRHRLPSMIAQPDGSVVAGWLAPGGLVRIVRLQIVTS